MKAMCRAHQSENEHEQRLNNNRLLSRTPLVRDQLVRHHHSNGSNRFIANRHGFRTAVQDRVIPLYGKSVIPSL
jgi:hypothetical protein